MVERVEGWREIWLMFVQTCVTTLVVRNMVRPFVRGRNILEQATPIGDILGDLAARLAELEAFKAQGGLEICQA